MTEDKTVNTAHHNESSKFYSNS